jgi:intracellular septation protein A
MEGFDLRHFVDTFNFEQLMLFFTSGQYQEVLHSKILLGVGLTFAALIAIPKTRALGTMALFYAAVGLVYGVGGVVIKNSNVSEIGPFLLMLSLALSLVGYFAWKNLLGR